MPNQHEEINLVTEDWNLLRPRIQDRIRHMALQQLEAQFPHTF